MRIGTVVIGTILAVLSSVTPAQAGLLTSATWVGETFGELRPDHFVDLFPGTPFTLVTSGASLTASGSATGSSIRTISVAVAAPPLSLHGQHHTGFSQTLGGSQTINSTNVANRGISGSVGGFVGAPNQGLLLYHIPLSVGVAGNFTTAAFQHANIPVEVTATHFPWTTGSQTLTGLTLRGVAAPNFTVAGTNSLVNGAGSITLVSPTRMRVCAGTIFGAFPCVPGASGNSVSFTRATTTRLTLNFPEPGISVLLAAGLVGLAARRRRS